jgi:phospholipid-transporting ATPase
VLRNLKLLALCHTIITEKQENELIYNASSPDELALINFAKFSGVEYIGMD